MTLACSLALLLGLAACGQTTQATNAGADNNGAYVGAGDVTYQLEISRELNPYSTEDSQYLAGLPTSAMAPKPDELWYGVFLWAKNQTKHPQTTTDRFDIVDTEGNRYYPLRLDSAVNQYAWTAQTLQPSGTEPGPDTIAGFGPTQGRLLLFKLGTSVYSNRPLTLEIYAPGQARPSTISLDL
jgi:hypothetical protein